MVAAAPAKGLEGALTVMDETTGGGGFGGGAMMGVSIAGAPATRPQGGGADISSAGGFYATLVEATAAGY